MKKSHINDLLRIAQKSIRYAVHDSGAGLVCDYRGTWCICCSYADMEYFIQHAKEADPLPSLPGLWDRLSEKPGAVHVWPSNFMLRTRQGGFIAPLMNNYDGTVAGFVDAERWDALRPDSAITSGPLEPVHISSAAYTGFLMPVRQQFANDWIVELENLLEWCKK